MSEVLERPAETRGKNNGLWAVRDKNAREPGPNNDILPRKHEILPGVIYPLFFHQDTFMPEGHARRFLKDPSFQVFDQNGDLVAPLSEQALSRAAPKSLAPNEVIATLPELSHAALLTRATMLLTGREATKIGAKTSREALIDFILQRNTEIQSDRAGDDNATADDMTAAELDKMFGG